jgi:RNA polymerase sigma factor (sigma-70 family)
MNDTTGGELLTSFVTGNTDAFDAFYDRYHRLVQSTVRQCAPRHLRTEVSDICQHFWVNLIRWGSSYDPKRPIETWLGTVIRRAIFSYSRQIGVTGVPVDSNLDTICTQAESVEATTIHQEEIGIVMEALEQLPPEPQSVVRAIILNGQSLTDYGKEHGLTESKVRNRLEVGLQGIRRSPAVIELRHVGV